MDQIRLAGELAKQDATDNGSPEPQPRMSAELRTLNDLELVLAGGGDGIPSWPK